MLDMFKREGDPKEYNYLYGIPGAVMLGGYAFGHLSGSTDMTDVTYLAASACCIGAIACLSQQSTARVGNALGMVGVTSGIAATMGVMPPSGPLFTQMFGLLGTGTALGIYLARRMKVTDLPQMVAAFHALVGAAATTTSISNFMMLDHMDNTHKITAFLGAFIGAVTLTGKPTPTLKCTTDGYVHSRAGSATAFGKLNGNLPSAPLSLPGKNFLNLVLAAGNVGAGVLFLKDSDPTTG